MKLVPDRYSTAHEREHAYPADDAQALVSQSFEGSENIEGIDDLRSYLMNNRDSEALEKIENGEWLLVKDEGYYFDWGRLDAGAQEQKTHHRVMSLMNAPPKPEARYGLEFSIVDSETGEPLVHRSYIATVDGKSTRYLTDGRGVAHIFAPLEGAKISIHVLFSSPVGEFEIGQE